MGESVQLIDLSTLNVIDVTGSDATSFLQGQFCNDIEKLSAVRAQINGYCTPKGRLLALPTALGMESGYRLLLPEQLTEALVKRLRMYVMRSDVTFTVRRDLVCHGLIVDRKHDADQLKTALGGLPDGIMDIVNTESSQLLRWHDDYTDTDTDYPASPRYLIIASAETLQTLSASIGDTPPASSNRWRAADISAGVPTLGNQTADAFVPQMLNLHLIDALSFKKGCYPGQEIVARMQYLGKLKRHMRLFHLPSGGTEATPLPLPGDNIATGSSAGDESDKRPDENAGVVIDAVQLATGNVALLAVTKVSANDASFTFAGQPLVPADLPYSLPSLEPDGDAADPA